MKHHLHRIGAITAFLCVLIFFSATLVSELFLSTKAIAQVKSLIAMPGLFILIPAIAITGATGFSMAKGASKGLVGKKKGRMPFIGANGVLVLIPSAIVLAQWAATENFGTAFYFVQGLELLAGATNIGLMFMNISDGRKLSGNRV